MSEKYSQELIEKAKRANELLKIDETGNRLMREDVYYETKELSKTYRANTDEMLALLNRLSQMKEKAIALLKAISILETATLSLLVTYLKSQGEAVEIEDVAEDVKILLQCGMLWRLMAKTENGTVEKERLLHEYDLYVLSMQGVSHYKGLTGAKIPKTYFLEVADAHILREKLLMASALTALMQSPCFTQVYDSICPHNSHYLQQYEEYNTEQFQIRNIVKVDDKATPSTSVRILVKCFLKNYNALTSTRKEHEEYIQKLIEEARQFLYEKRSRRSETVCLFVLEDFGQIKELVATLQTKANKFYSNETIKRRIFFTTDAIIHNNEGDILQNTFQPQDVPHFEKTINSYVQKKLYLPTSILEGKEGGACE